MPIHSGPRRRDTATLKEREKPRSTGRIESPTQGSGAVPDAQLDLPDGERNTAPVDKATVVERTRDQREPGGS